MASERVVLEERDVGFLVDPEAHFVSLVDRGANQIPFRIVKAWSGKETMVKRVLQEIIAPSDVGPEDLRAQLSEETFQMLKFDKTRDLGKFRVYEQVERDKFDEETLELVELDAEKGIRGIVGTLKEQGVIGKLFRRAEKKAVVEVPEELPTVSREELVKQYSAEVDEQLFAAVGAIASIMAQEGWDEKKRSRAISDALDALKEFLVGVVGITKGAAMEVGIRMEPVEEKVEEVVVGEEESLEAAVVEDVQKEEEVVEVVVGEEESLEAAVVEDVQKEEEVVEDVQKEEEVDQIQELRERLEQLCGLVESVKALAEAVEGIKAEQKEVRELVEKSAASPVVYRGEADVDRQKGERKREPVFKGIFDFS